MKKLISLIFIVSALLFTVNNANAQDVKEGDEATIEMKVGFHCGGGKATIEKNLKELKGVNEYTVDLKTKKVTVKYDKNVLTEDDVKKSILGLGYSVDGQKSKVKHKCGG